MPLSPDIYSCIKDGSPHHFSFGWRNFTHLLQEQATRLGDKPALIFHDLDSDSRKAISYKELERETASLAGHLHRDFGIGPGDRVAMSLPNCPEIPLLTLAVFRLGATTVPLDLAKDVPERKRYKLKDSHAKLLCVLPDNEAEDRKQFPDIPVATTAQLLTGKGPSSPDLEPSWSGDSQAELETNIILYTSGTTGNPKGVLESHT